MTHSITAKMSAIGRGWCVQHGVNQPRAVRTKALNTACRSCLLRNKSDNRQISPGVHVCNECLPAFAGANPEGLGQGVSQLRKLLQPTVDMHGGTVSTGTHYGGVEIDLVFAVPVLRAGVTVNLAFCVEMHGAEHAYSTEDLLDPVFAADAHLRPETRGQQSKVVFLACKSTEPLMWWVTLNWITMVINRVKDVNQMPMPRLTTIAVGLDGYPAANLPPGPNNIVTKWRPTPVGVTETIDRANTTIQQRLAARANMPFRDEAEFAEWLRATRGDMPAGFVWNQRAYTYWSTCIAPIQGEGPFSSLTPGRMNNRPLVRSSAYLPNMYPTHDNAGAEALGLPGNFSQSSRVSVRSVLVAISDDVQGRQAQHATLKERMPRAFAIMDSSRMQRVFYVGNVQAVDFTLDAIRS